MAFLSSAVPPAAVYFVKFCSSARMAACLMLSGVGKSGSPAPKSTTSTPSARSRSASCATFKVDDTLMEEIRSAIGLAVACITLGLRPFTFGFGNTPPQPLLDRRRDEPRNIAAEAENFLHQARADEGVGFVGHHKNGFDTGTEPAV